MFLNNLPCSGPHFLYYIWWFCGIWNNLECQFLVLCLEFIWLARIFPNVTNFTVGFVGVMFMHWFSTKFNANRFSFRTLLAWLTLHYPIPVPIINKKIHYTPFEFSTDFAVSFFSDSINYFAPRYGVQSNLNEFSELEYHPHLNLFILLVPILVY